MTTTGATDVNVAIVGSGFSGLGMAIRLKQAGIEDFVVLERAAEVGGTWYANTYPGLRLRRAVAPLLVLLRAQPRLDRRPTRPSPRSEAYLKGCCERFGIEPHLRLEHERHRRRLGRGGPPLGDRDVARGLPRRACWSRRRGR